VFVHTSAVESAGLRTLNEGQKISSEVGADRRTGKEVAASLQQAWEVKVVPKRPAKAEAFAARAREQYPALKVRATADVCSAVEGADLICTVTSSSEPVLMGDWVPAGAHVNVVGASVPSKREIDDDLVVRSRIFVDYRASTFAQAGEVIGALQSGLIGHDHVGAEIGEVLDGRASGRQDPGEITLYRSLGIAAQDLACAFHCWREGTNRGLGIQASLD
jgi:ornithine cyclodeaminase